MKDPIYELLNDIDSSPESYPAAQVTQKDMQSWKEAFKAKKHSSGPSGNRAVRKHRYVKYAAAAAAMSPRTGGPRAGEAPRPFFLPISSGRNGGPGRAGPPPRGCPGE